MAESPELSEILALTREFALGELRPRSEQWERSGALDDDTMAQLASLGFMGMAAPESAGGMGLDRVSVLSAVAMLGWGEASAGMAVALHAQVIAMVSRAKTSAARDRWLAPLAAGEVTGCAQATSVLPVTGVPPVPARAGLAAGAPAGSGPVAAEASGDGWVLRGPVPWVGNARAGGVLAAGAETPGGPLLCLVPLAAAGVRLEPPAATLGLRPLGLRTVVLDGVEVPRDAVLAGPGLGAGEAAALADDGALAVAAVAVGIARAALDHAREYAGVREQFGHRLRDFEGIRRMLADMAIRVAGARALLERAAAEPPASGAEPAASAAEPPASAAVESGGASAALDGGGSAAVAVAKVAAAEAALYVSTQAVQVFGGYGYMRDYPVEKLMRDARAMSLLGGADDGQRGRIAEALYRE